MRKFCVSLLINVRFFILMRIFRICFTQGFIKQVECTYISYKYKCISLLIQKSLEISLKENFISI